MTMDCRNCNSVGEDKALEDQTWVLCSRNKASLALSVIQLSLVSDKVASLRLHKAKF